MKICLDPGHGMSNRVRGRYDTGAVAGGAQEATIAMMYVNHLKQILEDLGHKVVRTRVDENDPCPVWRRDDIAASYQCERMLSIHCNSTDGKANGTEVFYRGKDDEAMAMALASAVSASLGTKNRGAKTEAQSQHSALAVMEFDKCWLVELAFIDHKRDREAMLNAANMHAACVEMARCITS